MGKYILLSIAINAFLLSMASVGKHVTKPILTPLEINIMALAKPNIEVVKPEEKPKPKSKAILTPIKTQVAKKTIAIKKPKKITKPKKPKKPTKPKKAKNNNKGKQISTVLHKAKYKSQFQPPIQYPSVALRRGVQGRVVLKVLINEFGKPEKIEIKQAATSYHLNDAAIKAVWTWEFLPLTQNGKAIKSWVEVPVEFKIKAN